MFDARHPVAAEHFWHVKERMPKAEMGSHTGQGRKGAKVFETNTSIVTPKRTGLCLHGNWINRTVPVRPAPQGIDHPHEAVQESQDTIAQALPSPRSR